MNDYEVSMEGLYHISINISTVLSILAYRNSIFAYLSPSDQNEHSVVYVRGKEAVGISAHRLCVRLHSLQTLDLLDFSFLSMKIKRTSDKALLMCLIA